MPQPFNNAVMTNAGARLLTRAQVGEIKIEFTRIAIGSGTYTEEEKTLAALQERTELKEIKNSYTLSDIEVYSDYSVKVTALITNQDPATGQTLVEAGYYINEMGLFAKIKDESDDTEVLYSIVTTAGDNGDFMPPYNGYNPAQIIQDYFATVNNSGEVTIKMGAGACVLREDFDEAMQAISQSIVKRKIQIPVSGWNKEDGSFFIDIEQDDVTESMIPFVSILPGFLDTAKACCMSTIVQTLDGKIRFYAGKAPGSEIHAELTLIQTSSGPASGGFPSGVGYTLPTATEERLGGVKIGSGVNVKEDGTISVKAEELSEEMSATDKEVSEMFDNIFTGSVQSD